MRVIIFSLTTIDLKIYLEFNSVATALKYCKKRILCEKLFISSNYLISSPIDQCKLRAIERKRHHKFHLFF